MNHPQGELLTHRLHAVQEQYAQLFVLMDRSTQETPTEGRSQLDRIIEDLMGVIDHGMKEFRREVEASRRSHALGEALNREISEFDVQLREGLELMLARVRQRTTELANEREEMKGRLQLIQRKRTGAKGYRGHISQSAILDSRA